MRGRVLVAGIGNIFLGDDAFGSELARRLLRDQWPEGVHVVDFGIRGFDLTFALLEGYEFVVLLDASARGGAPGTLYLVEPELPDAESAAVETHAMDPLRVLAVARSMGAEWKRVLLVACEPSPESIDPDGPGALGLSHEVSSAVEEAVGMVRRTVCEWILADSPKS